MKGLLVLGLAFKLTFSFNVAGQGADIYTTGACVGKGFHEANPALRPLEDHPWALGAVKTGVASLTALSAYELNRRGKRKLAILVNLSSGTLGVLLARRNARTCSL
jgi:hypothetical protein